MYPIFKYLWNHGEIKEIPLNKDDIKTYRDEHYSRVYNDTDFKNDLAELRNQHNDNIATATDTTARLRHFEPLANKWHITPDEVDSAYEGGEPDGSLLHGLNEPAMIVDVDAFKTQDRITVDLDLVNLKKSDLDDLWKMIALAKASRSIPLTRNRHPENTDLIYSVFKARMRGETFPTIFRQYEDGTLIGYKDKSSGQFKSSDSLGRYYRKYIE